MADAPATSSDRGRGRARGRSRGGLGKYLRARGRGRSYGRPAEFTKRLVLEDEQPVDPDPEQAEEVRRRYANRTLVSNADRYEEEEVELDPDDEAETEIDLSAFLARQRSSLSSEAAALGDKDEDEDEIDDSLDISSKPQRAMRPQKGRVQTIEWDASLEEMRRDSAVADANRDLKARLRAGKAGTSRIEPMAHRERRRENDVVEAPPLPVEGAARKDPKNEMQDFLDDLLA